ncbi:hypothetical protein PHMEG_00019871 [Phytophthora megakarya]|uniref:PX domain-containing protein n=1 Tax=Phytophthora megakarya TaxID=4795 RepID=A0A225VQJ1_9STRA|nr:hypothetical protein PHMEG_00019871 [Phytophthora megakarya]
MRTSNVSTKSTRESRRELAIDNFSQTSAASAWYYRVNVSVYEDVLVSTFLDDSDSFSEDDISSGASILTDVEHYSISRRYSDFLQLYEQIRDTLQATQGSTESSGASILTDVEHYSISRRYSDFLQLYEQIRDILQATQGSTGSLPSFPAKEFISPALKGMFRCTSSSKIVLLDRTAKFEALLQWIENHPVARNCQGYLQFIGKPPKSHNGYVSLKEYTPSDWLVSLHQTTQGVESRRRRYSMGNFFRERSISEVSGGFGSFRENPEFVRDLSSMRGRYSM